MATTLSVGIIGCGKIAHADHVPNLLNVKGVSIDALHDVSPKQMNLLNNAFDLNATCYKTLDALLSASLDAVVICTPNSFHYPQTMSALKAGLHVLCDKPMAATTAECTRMIAAARKADKILHINQTLHYWPVFIALPKLVAAGKIGKVQHIRCLRFHSTSPDVGWSPGAKWFVSSAYDGGIVLDIGVHMADVMKWIGGPVTEVFAITDTRAPKIDVADNARALMRFENGATGVLELSWTAASNSGLLEVYGEKGTLRMGFAPDGQIELIKQTCRSPEPSISHPKPPKSSPTSQQAFVDAVHGKAPSRTPGELGREAVALCEAILKSGEQRRYVKVKRFE